MPFKNRHVPHDPVWPVQLAMLVAIALQVALPDTFSAARYAIPAAELLLLIALSFTTPKERIFRSMSRRINVILLIALTSAANAYSLGVVCNRLLQGGHVSNGRELILTSINIFLTNIIIFGLWYWEMDGGGPGERSHIAKYEQDFLFPQHHNEDYKHPDWKPTFLDYLYVSSTNAMTFGPADTKPLSRRAKMLMLLQSTISLIVVALVAARAVGILN
ncbi:MAG TPA: hypothetical protein VFH39_00185 [Candidatus Saccharimonadales bacterium]|nr:hypothetical protein [Candidatus Saccharimonadales bacterium]